MLRPLVVATCCTLALATPAGAAGSMDSHLKRIAWCESRNRADAVSPGGTYRGLFQFDYTTWRGVGGHGDPARASVREQWKRARILYRLRGAQPWPVCRWR